MTTIGTDAIPGIKTTVDTADTVAIDVDAPTDLALVGPADLANGTASANDVVAITQPQDARDAFGEPKNSMLTRQVFDALGEGAMPIYACPTDEISVTGEDLSGMSTTSGQLTNHPVPETSSGASFTIDGSAKNTVITYGDPHSESVASGEVHLNPVSGKFELDAAPGDTSSTNDTVDYSHYDYVTAHDAVADQRGDTVDFLAPVQENTDVTSDAQATVTDMESFYNFAVALCGLPPSTTISADMGLSYDDSRLQVVFPGRDADNESAIGAYAGRKASLGIIASAMGKSLSTKGRMRTRLSRQDSTDLVANNVVPIRSSTSGARIVDDPTTVTDSNSAESGMRQGYARLVMDNALAVIEAVEEPFIGRLNTQEARNALENLISTGLQELEETDAVEEYVVEVSEKDATSVKVSVTVDTTDPLRNIYNTVTAGQVA